MSTLSLAVRWREGCEWVKIKQGRETYRETKCNSSDGGGTKKWQWVCGEEGPSLREIWEMTFVMLGVGLE